MNLPRYVVAFDVETTGPNVVKHAMVEFGVAVYATEGTFGHPVATYNSGLIRTPKGTQWDPVTLREFWLNEDNGGIDCVMKAQCLRKEGRNNGRYKLRYVQEVMAEFEDWAASIRKGYDKETCVVVCDNPGFDESWMATYLCLYGSGSMPGMSYFLGKHKNIHSTKSYTYGLTKSIPGVRSSDAVRPGQRIGVDWLQCPTMHSHDAHDDACDIAARFVAILRHTAEKGKG